VVTTLLSRPALTFARNWYTDMKDRRAARALGAVSIPHVPESSFTVARKVLRSLDDFPGELMAGWGRKYGYTVSVSKFTSRTVVTYDPELIKALLATRFDSFEKGPQFRSQCESLLGTGVFNADGDMWKFHRAMTRPFFTRERISDFDIYDRHCDSSLDLARARLGEGYPIDFQDLVRRFTLDAASEFLFGHNVESLSAGIPYPPCAEHKNPPSFINHSANIFAHAFSQGQMYTTGRTAFGNEWPLAEFWKDKILPDRKVMDNFTEPLMREALARREANLKSAEKGDKTDNEDPTLLPYLVRHTQDPKIITDELVNLLVAGRDTTAALLTFAMYMLAEHPDIENRLRQEVFDKVGPTHRPTYDSMREMKFMRAFLNEVLRLYPPVPMNTRRSTRAVVVTPVGPNQRPLYIPADTDCLYGVVNLHRRTDLWGPDALKFDPDRFLDERVHKYLTPNPFIFLPFNAGPRICLGQQFAYHEATFFLVRLLQRFTGFKLDSSTNIKPPAVWAGTGTKPIDKIHALSHLTIYVKGGLWVYMTELETEDSTTTAPS